MCFVKKKKKRTDRTGWRYFHPNFSSCPQSWTCKMWPPVSWFGLVWIWRHCKAIFIHHWWLLYKDFIRLKFCQCWLAYYECISQNYYDSLHYLTVFWGRLFVLLERNQKPARQMFFYQHILEIHNSEIRVNSQHSSLLKCTFPAYDIWETWEQDHISDTIFEFLKIFCAYIFFVIRHGCIYQEISNSDVHKYPYTSLSCEIEIKKCTAELVRPIWNQPGVWFLPALCSSVPVYFCPFKII